MRVGDTLLHLALFFMMLFFLLRDGPALGAEIRGVSPFSRAQEADMVRHLTATELDPVMIPKSLLNDLRRQAAEELTQLRAQTRTIPIADLDALTHLREEAATLHPEPGSTELATSGALHQTSVGVPSCRGRSHERSLASRVPFGK